VRVDYQGKSFTFTKVEQSATDANTRRDTRDATVG
jgi:hypothetical protein